MKSKTISAKSASGLDALFFTWLKNEHTIEIMKLEFSSHYNPIDGENIFSIFILYK